MESERAMQTKAPNGANSDGGAGVPDPEPALFFTAPPRRRPRRPPRNDESAEALSDTEGELLFDGDKPGSAGIRGRDFCTAFQAQVQATRAFADAVAAAGLLVENRAQVVLKDRRAMGVSGFRVIDEAKF